MAPTPIAEARRKLGLTLDELGDMLGYRGKYVRQHMHALETGKRRLPAAARLLLIAYLEGYRPKGWPGDGLYDVVARARSPIR